MNRLLSYPIDWPNADVRNVGDVLAMLAAYWPVYATCYLLKVAATGEL